MSARGVLRRSESPTLLSALTPLAVCGVIACAIAAGPVLVRAQESNLTPAEALHLADSLAHAESLRVADSVHVADSLAQEDELASAAGSFGNKRSILDRNRQRLPVLYTTSYSVNRSNRSWNQNLDMYVKRGDLEFANITSANIGREVKVGRLNRNSQTQNEVAYRVSPWLRLGGRFGLQRISDQARTRNFTSTRQDVDDLSGQALFNRRFGEFPVRSAASYGYLKNVQVDQQSRGTEFSIAASTSRAWGTNSNLNFDVSEQLSRLRSTVASDPNFQQDDRNSNTRVHLGSSMRLLSWVSADAQLSAQRSVLRRPQKIQPNPQVNEFITVPEKIAGVSDAATLGFHLSLPRQTTMNLSGNVNRNRNVYTAVADRSSLVDTRGFAADFHRVQFGTDLTLRYDESVTDNDYTRRDPGYVEANLLRKLEGEAARKLSLRTNARFSLGIYLGRRAYEKFRSNQPTAVAPSNQDQLRVRGSLNVLYRPGPNFDTGVTFGLEQNDLVNIKNTASINNARLRTYSVAWNWSARPGTIWNVNQSNSATAAQQFFTFSPERDQLSFIYSLNTAIATQFSQKVRFDLNHIVRLQSRGSFRQTGDVRRFGKSSEFNTLDLLLREQYQATSFATFEISQRLAVNPNYQFENGHSRKINETRRNELTLVARINYPMGARSSLSGDVRRVLATDRQRSFGTSPTDASTNSDYWLANLSFSLELQP